MKKIILTMIILFTMVFSVNAQIATENAKLFDNVYFGIEGGVSTPLDFNSVFPVNPIAGIKLGKEFTPVLGVELEGQVFFNENNLLEWTKTFVKGTNVGLNGTLNLTNLFLGYKGTPRVFELKTNTGLGWLHRWDNGGDNALTAKTALDINFNLGKKKAHTITVTPGVWWVLGDNGSKIAFDKRRAQLGVFLGYTYHFKTSNGTHHFKMYDVGAMIDDIERLNAELAKKPTEVPTEVPVPVIVNITDRYVFFAYDSAELDDRAKAELDELAENGVYVIDAYSSSEGNTEYNLNLSQRRADAVREYLEARGCKVDSAVGHGVQFGTTTGRVAIVSVK